jgi:hypothetical protein
VAAHFASERNLKLNRVLLGVALLAGMVIAYVDSRPNWDDAGITPFSMLLVAGVWRIDRAPTALALIGDREPVKLKL